MQFPAINVFLYHLVCQQCQVSAALFWYSCDSHALTCRAELQHTGEELLSAFAEANAALKYIPPVTITGVTVKSAKAKVQGMHSISDCCHTPDATHSQWYMLSLGTASANQASKNSALALCILVEHTLTTPALLTKLSINQISNGHHDWGSQDIVNGSIDDHDA